LDAVASSQLSTALLPLVAVYGPSKHLVYVCTASIVAEQLPQLYLPTLYPWGTEPLRRLIMPLLIRLCGRASAGRPVNAVAVVCVVPSEN